MTDKQQTTDDEEGDQIEGLARDLARRISAAPAEQRERLREMAVHRGTSRIGIELRKYLPHQASS